MWMKRNLDKMLTSLIEKPDSITKKMLNIGYVRQLQREHTTGQADHQRILFLLLSIETWNEVFA